MSLNLCALPGIIPPAGATTNFIDPPSLTSATYGIGISLLIWAFFFASVRLWVNRRKMRIADYFVIASVVLDVASTVLTILIAKYDRHQWDIPYCELNMGFIKLLLSVVLVSAACNLVAKISIFLLYLQLFTAGNYRRLRLATYIGLTICCLTYVPYIPLTAIYVANVFRVIDVGQPWNQVADSTAYLHMVYWIIAQGASAVVLDMFILGLPLPLVWRLSASFERRVQLLVVFGTAVLGVAASVLALAYRVRLLETEDITWEMACACIAVMAENNAAIVVGSMPAFATFTRAHIIESPLFKRLQSLPCFRRRSNRGRPSHGSMAELPADAAPGPAGVSAPTIGSPRSPLPRSLFELPGLEARPELDAGLDGVVPGERPEPVADSRGGDGGRGNVDVERQVEVREESTDRLVGVSRYM